MGIFSSWSFATFCLLPVNCAATTTRTDAIERGREGLLLRWFTVIIVWFLADNIFYVCDWDSGVFGAINVVKTIVLILRSKGGTAMH